jgi:MtN3 and saliva related transmembrane protein
VSPQITEPIGFLAGTLTTVSFLPQLVKTWKTRSAGDLSMGTLVIFSAGVTLWLTYGLLRHSWPMILANGLTVAETVFLMVMKLRDARGGGV